MYSDVLRLEESSFWSISESLPVLLTMQITIVQILADMLLEVAVWWEKQIEGLHSLSEVGLRTSTTDSVRAANPSQNHKFLKEGSWERKTFEAVKLTVSVIPAFPARTQSTLESLCYRVLDAIGLEDADLDSLPDVLGYTQEEVLEKLKTDGGIKELVSARFQGTSFPLSTRECVTLVKRTNCGVPFRACAKS